MIYKSIKEFLNTSWFAAPVLFVVTILGITIPVAVVASNYAVKGCIKSCLSAGVASTIELCDWKCRYPGNTR
jgi:hypothetical protein